jgi:hypothetical protein
VCSKVYKCSSISASIFSKKAFEILRNEGTLSLEIICPEGINESTFEDEFENVFKIVYGFPFCVTRDNFGSVLSISTQLDNSTILEECFEYLKTFDFENVESLLWILNFAEFVPQIPVNVSMISTNFETTKFDLFLDLAPSAMSKILKCDALRIESEDSLLEFLLEYWKRWNSESIPLFENVYLEYLNESSLTKFTNFYSQLEPSYQLQLSSSMRESFLFILSSKPRSIPKHRHSSRTEYNSIPSLFNCRSQIKSLENIISTLKDDFNLIVSQNKDLQTQNSDQQQTIFGLNSEKKKLNTMVQGFEAKNAALQNQNQIL